VNTKLAFFLGLIIVMGLVASYTILFLTETSEKNLGKGELRIVSHIGYVESVENVTFFTVKGIVQNNYAINMRDIMINATFYDVEKRAIGNAYGYAAFTIVKPEQKTPFDVYVSYRRVQGVYNYSLTVVGIKTDEEPINKLQIANESSTVEEAYYRVVGEVLNEARRKAVLVKVICAYYDSEDNLMAMSRAFTSPNSIGAGGKASFEINLEAEGIIPDKFELFVVPHHYEVLFVGNYVLLIILISAFVVFVVYMKHKRGW